MDEIDAVVEAGQHVVLTEGDLGELRRRDREHGPFTLQRLCEAHSLVRPIGRLHADESRFARACRQKRIQRNLQIRALGRCHRLHDHRQGRGFDSEMRREQSASGEERVLPCTTSSRKRSNSTPKSSTFTPARIVASSPDTTRSYAGTDVQNQLRGLEHEDLARDIGLRVDAADECDDGASRDLFDGEAKFVLGRVLEQHAHVA